MTLVKNYKGPFSKKSRLWKIQKCLYKWPSSKNLI